jgi:para-nitrobenzyl esterase
MKSLPQNWVVLLSVLLGWQVVSAQPLRPVQVRITDGVLEGVVSADDQVRTFKGVPYAAPPVGPLRWKPPQPVQPWTGVRPAADFGPRPMQWRIFGDMVFRDDGPGEDCLYLNLWMPEHPAPGKLPVMVWIYGGGFAAGATSEPRQDGGNLSKKGVIVVSFGYRLGVFGFFAHPELTKESEHQASGNYGLLDQVAALKWVRTNIAAFGGDPDNVTIFGESAGSFSVSALMASPLSQGLFQRAIGESGAFFGHTLPAPPLAEAEADGEQFAESAFYAHSLKDLRALPSKYLLRAARKRPWEYFKPDIDGYLLPTNCLAIYTSGQQSHVPLLAGWNRDEGGYESYFTNDAPTLNNYVQRAHAFFGTNAEAFLAVYAATTDAQAKRAAQDFAGDRFIGYCTWKWLELQLQTGQSPVYRYLFGQTLPLPSGARAGTEPTAPHASDIEFVFEMLPSRHLPWRPEDRKVSELMADYWSNFAKTGNPNGPGLPVWPQYNRGDDYPVMHLSADPGAAPDAQRARYEFLDQLPQPW